MLHHDKFPLQAAAGQELNEVVEDKSLGTAVTGTRAAWVSPLQVAPEE